MFGLQIYLLFRAPEIKSAYENSSQCSWYDNWKRSVLHVNTVSMGILSYCTQRITKPTKWYVRPAKTQISLGIRPIWSEFSLSAWRTIGSLATHWAHSEDSDQIERMSRLTWVFGGRTCYFVGFVLRWLECKLRVGYLAYQVTLKIQDLSAKPNKYFICIF